jgi:hypothetical protein
LFFGSDFLMQKSLLVKVGLTHRNRVSWQELAMNLKVSPQLRVSPEKNRQIVKKSSS